MSYLYCNPGDFGLESVAEWDAYDVSYEFTIVLVVRRKSDGTLWVAEDAGCSCPVPFEDHQFPDDFTPVKSWDDVKPLVLSKGGVSLYRSKQPHDSFRAAVRRALNKTPNTGGTP